MLLLDGPMGTELTKRGVATPAPGWSAYAIESHPSVVVDIHEAYARAGARAHRGNTFRTQPKIFPSRYVDLVQRAHALLRAGVAGGAGGAADAVIGCLAPVEDCYRPYLSPPTRVARGAHRKMAEALRDAGFDTILCETFPHAGEAVVAVEEAVRTGLPTWVALTAGPDGTLMTPEAMERAARDCISAGAGAVLVCCTAATKTLAYVERLARTGARFGAHANAGDPQTGLGWGAEPTRAAAAYADFAAEWIASGASIVGSCCGTGPAHIAELAMRFG
jgi:S-methylmethionine-dependent homocysteine/selenocysteine methylase